MRRAGQTQEQGGPRVHARGRAESGGRRRGVRPGGLWCRDSAQLPRLLVVCLAQVTQYPCCCCFLICKMGIRIVPNAASPAFDDLTVKTGFLQAQELQNSKVVFIFSVYP